MALKYQIALCSVWWKRGDIDCRLFTSLQEQIEYFANKIDHWSDLVNFPVNDADTTTITFRDNSTKSIYEIIESNYAIIKKSDGDNVTYRYYFAKLYQDSGRQFIVDLNLDDFQTNYLNVRGNALPALIRRATISRFKPDKTFNFSSNSKMHLKEGVSHSQRLVKRERVKIAFTEYDVVNEWLNENVAGWHYYFCDSSLDYIVAQIPYVQQSQSKQIKSNLSIHYKNNKYTAPYGVFVAPNYITDKRIIINDNGRTYIPDEEGLNDFLDRNSAITSGKVYGSKYSVMPPFAFGYFREYSIDADGNLVINPVFSDEKIMYLCYDNDNLKGSCGVVIPADISYSFNNWHACIVDATFTKDSLDFEIDLRDYINFAPNPKGYSRNKLFNPKMLQSDYTKLRLANENNYFDYYFDLLDNNILSGKYAENILIGTNKSYGRISSGLYVDETLDNFTGVVSNYDTSIPLVRDKWDEYIANNKNFFLQAGFSYASSLIRGGVNMLSGRYEYGISAGLSGYDKMSSAIFSKDNMENAPQSLALATGDPFFIMQAHPLGLYYELYDCLDVDKEIDNDNAYFNGYVVDTYGRLYEYDHIRKYFDFLQADINILNLTMSNDEKQRITDLLKNGVRMWHDDTFAGYMSENYELIFDEE